MLREVPLGSWIPWREDEEKNIFNQSLEIWLTGGILECTWIQF